MNQNKIASSFMLLFACACTQGVPVTVEAFEKDAPRIVEALDNLGKVARIDLEISVAEPPDDFPSEFDVDSSFSSLSVDHGEITVYGFQKLTREDGEFVNGVTSGVRNSTAMNPKCTRHVGLGMEDLESAEDLQLAVNLMFGVELGVEGEERPDTALWFYADEAELEYMSLSQLEAFEKAADIYSRRCGG